MQQKYFKEQYSVHKLHTVHSIHTACSMRFRSTAAKDYLRLRPVN